MIKPQELSSEHKRMWGDTMSLMAWTAPGFRHLFYKLLSNNAGEHTAIFTDEVATAATDGKNILANPDFLFKLSLKERVFVMAHEVMHNVYDDVAFLNRCMKQGTVPMSDGSTLPCKEKLMQAAMDFRINALLVESRIGALPERGHFDPEIATGNDGLIDVYKKVYVDEENNPGKYGPDPFDMVLSPGVSTGGPGQPRNQQQWSVEVAAAQHLEQMRAQGKMPGALQRMFEEILNPEIPWTDHIQSIFNRKVGSGSYDWKRPDRRFIIRDIVLPGRSGHGAGWLVVWGDTSGSIGRAELEKYLAELGGIIEDVKPRRLTVLWCDAQIHRIDECEDATDLHRIRHAGVGGGGGTSVHPVFEWINDQLDEPEMFIGFTDGCVTFPDVPPFPVIWASVTDHDYPYGDVVRINPKK